MTITVRNFQQYYDIYRNEVVSRDPTLTDFSEGAINDLIAGATCTAIQEATNQIIEDLRKTFIRTANGPEVTEDDNNDELEVLATDHFGDTFARPGPQKSVGVVTFSRPTATAGNVTILAGTVVKTGPDAAGNERRFRTLLPVTMTSLSISASVECTEAGTSGNVDPGDISIIETTLTDGTITVTNDLGTTGGEDTQTDGQYRDTIYLLIETLKGATKKAVTAKAQLVPGVLKATVTEAWQSVIDYDESTNLPLVGASAFKIPRVRCYVSDANGVASTALKSLVITALDDARACGVFVDVVGSQALELDADFEITLNGSGPNFASLSQSLQPIIDDLIDYIEDLDIGADFIRTAAIAYIMAIWGPSGSNDITAMTFNTPAGDVATDVNEKIIPGNVTAD